MKASPNGVDAYYYKIIDEVRKSNVRVRYFSYGEAALTVNDEVVQGEAAILDRIHSSGKENLSDTVLLNTGMGYSME